MPLTIPSTAWSSAASSKTTFAALPPSSSVSRLPVPASSAMIALPTSVEPVKATLSTPGCLTSSAPVRPSPVTMLTTPGGRGLARALLEGAGDAERVLGALGGRGRRPAVLEGLAGRRDRERDVLRPCLRDLGERLLGRRVDRRVPLARARLDEPAADEE